MRFRVWILLSLFFPLDLAYASGQSALNELIENKQFEAAQRSVITSLSNDPNALENWALLARLSSWLGDLGFSLAIYEYLVFIAPTNADYLFGRGQVLFWSGNLEGSLKSLEMGRKVAPEYRDLLRYEIKILSGVDQNNRRTYRASLFEHAKRLRDDESLRAMEAWDQQADSTIKTGIGYVFNYDYLSNGYQPWQEHNLSISGKAEDFTLVLGHTWATRYALSNYRFDSSFYFKKGSLKNRIDFAHTYSGIVLERWKIAYALSFPLSSYWRLGITPRLQRFSDTDSYTVTNDLDYRYKKNSFGVSLLQGWLDGAGYFYGLSAKYRRTISRIALESGVNWGKELAYIPNRDPGVFLVSGVYVKSVIPIHRNILFSIGAGYARQGDSYERIYVSAGLRH